MTRHTPIHCVAKVGRCLGVVKDNRRWFLTIYQNWYACIQKFDRKVDGKGWKSELVEILGDRGQVLECHRVVLSQRVGTGCRVCNKRYKGYWVTDCNYKRGQYKLKKNVRPSPAQTANAWSEPGVQRGTRSGVCQWWHDRNQKNFRNKTSSMHWSNDMISFYSRWRMVQFIVEKETTTERTRRVCAKGSAARTTINMALMNDE